MNIMLILFAATTAVAPLVASAASTHTVVVVGRETFPQNITKAKENAVSSSVKTKTADINANYAFITPPLVTQKAFFTSLTPSPHYTPSQEVKYLSLLKNTTAIVSNIRTAFDLFKVRHRKKAYASQEEEDKRFEIFVHNMAIAAELQAHNPFAVFGANAFADLSYEDFNPCHQISNARNRTKPQSHTVSEILPIISVLAHVGAPAVRAGAVPAAALDWRAYGVVADVRDTTKTACENQEIGKGRWSMGGRALVEMIINDRSERGCGCAIIYPDNSHLTDTKLSDADNHHVKIRGEGDNPSQRVSRPFTPNITNAQAQTGAKTSAHTRIESYKSEESLIQSHLISVGPVKIKVDSRAWVPYSEGIMTVCFSRAVDHEALIVGYDDSHTPPYWIIQNTWGENWGEKGYLRLEKGKGLCMLTAAGPQLES